MNATNSYITRIESTVTDFVSGSIDIETAVKKTGKSRATVYRYARRKSRGLPIIDNNRARKYGVTPFNPPTK